MGTDSHIKTGRKLYFGTSYVYESGSDLTFYDPTVAAEKTLTQLLAASAGTLDNAFDNGKVIDGATSLANAFQIGGANDKLTIWEEASNDVRIGTTTGANLNISAAGGTIDFNDEALVTTGKVTADGGVEIGADNVKLTLGASDATDAYAQFNGTDLVLYDSNYGAEITLSQLAANNFNSPTFTGDVTVSDGKISWTDATDEEAGSFNFSNTTNNDLSWVSSVTTGNCLHITADDITSGSMIELDNDQAGSFTGEYIRCFDGAAQDFAVKLHGEIEIAGSDGSDMLTITAGDIQVDDGKIEVDCDSDLTTYVKRNQAVTTGPVVEIEATNAGDDQPCLLIDHNSTGDVNAVALTTAGTGYAVSATLGNTAGEGLEVIFATGGTGNGILLDGNTGTYVGADGAGMLHIHQSGTLAHANATCAFINFDGTYATNGLGGCLLIDDDGTADGTNASVLINSANVRALQVDDGQARFNDDVVVAIADTVNVDALTVDQNDVTNNKDGLVVTCAGTGKGVKVTTETATGGGNHFICAANQTTANVTVDGDTSGWLGADGVGMVHLTNDIAHGHANASMLLIDKSAAIAEVNDARGTCLRVVENMNVSGSPPAYAVYISSTNNEALYIDSGVFALDEKMELNRTSAGAGLGHIKIGGTADHGTAAGENVITIWNGAAKPAGVLANAASLYTEAGELEAIDAGGAETTLSPHSKDGDYMINSYDLKKDTTFRAHLELILDWLVEKFPEISGYVEHIPGRAALRPRQSSSPVRVSPI